MEVVWTPPFASCIGLIEPAVLKIKSRMAEAGDKAGGIRPPVARIPQNSVDPVDITLLQAKASTRMRI